MSENANRLIHATSPYLLQHAHNPVDWHEWGTEALDKAKAEDKPILVSIGYSSCHWCHVMERECFENRDLADLMNEFFVCIKIDREERPDLDQLYMEAVQAMGVNGGWPLNVFLTPDQRPFYGGTYFQPQAWAQLLRGLHAAYRNRRSDVDASAASLAEALAASDIDRFMQRASPMALRDEARAIYEKLSPGFDTAWGGMDKAPKFVMPSVWMLIMRYHYLTDDAHARDHLLFTLRKIAMGGIYDQVGGGFARYSVDREWFAPHFEKMLYDNAQLLTLYADAYALAGDKSFMTVLDETFAWLSREMTHPEGAFYSALDADSEGVEGKYYIWPYQELEQTVGNTTPLVATYYNATHEGNWEHGANILMRRTDDAAFLTQHQLDEGHWYAQLQQVKEQLLAVRKQRVTPGLDDKILTAWNAMTITGLVSAYKATNDIKFLDAAGKCMNFLRRYLMDGTTIYRSYKNKRSATAGFLDDYAFMIQSLVQLYQVTFDETLLTQAQSLLVHAIDVFYDPHDGYFFFTSSTAEKLIARKKEVFDNVIPSSNAVMAQNLFHLGTLLDNDTWKDMARRMVDNLGQLIVQEPHYMSYWAMVKWEIARGLHEVVFAGPGSGNLFRQYMQHFEPYSVRLGTESSSTLSLLADMQSDRAAIFVCHNKVCQLPVTTAAEALKMVL